MTMVISERHTGHPPSITNTRIAHASQKRACPQGTSAKPPCALISEHQRSAFYSPVLRQCLPQLGTVSHSYAARCFDVLTGVSVIYTPQ